MPDLSMARTAFRDLAGLGIPLLRVDLRLRVKLSDFAVESNANHNGSFATFVEIILSDVEKNFEGAFTHNANLFFTCNDCLRSHATKVELMISL